MPRFLLAFLLVLSALVAATPGLSWLAGRWLPVVDERWMELLGTSATTVPIGMALAALVLVIHGLRTNRQLTDEVLDELDELHEQAAFAAPTATAGGAAAAPPAAGAGKQPGKAKKRSGRAVKRTGRRVTQRGKGMARREMRKAMPRI